MKVCYRHRGAISVFLCLILLPTLVFGGLVTDAVRIYQSEGLVSEAGELAMNAGLSYYDMELKDAYGLLAMKQTPEELTTSLEKYFVDTIRASGLSGADEVSSLIDLTCDDFHAYGVDGSQIYQTEAEKQQILEYMKYRAPVCLGEALVERLETMKDAKKQVEAMEAQMDFAESMENLQEACEQANEAIARYCTDVEQSVPALTTMMINAALDEAGEHLKKASEYYFVLDVIAAYEDRGAADDGTLLESMEDFNTWAEALSEYQEDSLEDDYVTYLNCLFYQKNIPVTGLDERIRQLVEAADSEDTAEDIQETYSTYETNRAVLSAYIFSLEAAAKAELNQAWGCISRWIVQLDKAVEDAGKAVEKLENLKGKFTSAQGTYGAWTGKISGLADGELKTSMSTEAEKYTDLLEEEKLEALCRKFEDNTQHLEHMLSCLRETKFCGLSLAQGSGSGAADSVENAVADRNFFPESNDRIRAEAERQAEQFAEAQYEKTEIPDGDELLPIRDDPFYLQLQDICEKDPETAQSQEDKNTTDHLLERAKSALTGDGIDELEDIDWSAQTLPSDLLAQSAADDEPDDYVLSEGGTNRSGRKKAIAGAKNSLNGMADFLDTLIHILEDGIENIYITEYGMQMFSYYTVNRNPDGSTITGDITSISDDDLTDNQLYRGEVEYMLWGQKNIQQNVKNTRLLLYGIRMVFNMIYVFSDSTVANTTLIMAEAMACGIQFLVPVFNVVLKVALAGAETALDVTDLMAGKKVPLIKKAANCQIRLRGMPSSGNRGEAPDAMSYRDYLTVFLLIKTFGSMEAKTLARIADCIQLNTEMDITKGYTMISVKAEVESRTTFMSKAANLPDGAHRGTVNDWYTIPYQSVLGY